MEYFVRKTKYVPHTPYSVVGGRCEVITSHVKKGMIDILS